MGQLAKEEIFSSIHISVGWDCRLSGQKYAKALMLGLQSKKAQVIELGAISTPMSYFSVFYENKCNGSIMVTGSHNPPNYNGFKMCIGEKALFREDIRNFESILMKTIVYIQKIFLFLPKNIIFSQNTKTLS